jgi:hypothetical protein
VTLKGRRLGYLAAAVSIATLVTGAGVQMHTRAAAAGYSKPVTGSWTQDGTYPWGGSFSPSSYDVSMTFNWLPNTDGSGWVGHSVLRGHVTSNADGTGTYKAFELFIGTVDGRQGELVLYNEGTLSNFSDYQGTGRCLTGAEGLAGIQCFGSYVGRINVGGHWTSGSYELR